MNTTDGTSILERGGVPVPQGIKKKATMKRLTLLTVGILLLTNIATLTRASNHVIVNDDFESYEDDADFEASWVPMDGQGLATVSGPIGVLLPRPNGDLIQPPAPYDGSGDSGVFPPVEPLVGKAVAFSGGGSINEWDNDGDVTTDPFQLRPDAANNVHYSADIFDFVDGNRRFSAGLRHDSDTDPTLFGPQQVNFIELGFWNDNVVDPTDGVTEIPDSSVHGLSLPGYAYRIIQFSNPGGSLIQNPDWQFFELPIEYDDTAVDHNNDGRFGNGDGLVNAQDVGPGWHRFSAEVSESSVTVELDLFRDGSIDASQTWEIEMATNEILGDVAYFNSLRLGGPSGVTANEFTMVDNVKLELVPATNSLSCDLDGDGRCDHDDLDILYGISPSSTDIADWLVDASDPSNPALPSGATFVLGDLDLDGTVVSSDLGMMLNNFNDTTGTNWLGGDLNADSVVDSDDLGLLLNSFGFGVATVPEPAPLILLAAAMTSLIFTGSRRKSKKLA